LGTRRAPSPSEKVRPGLAQEREKKQPRRGKIILKRSIRTETDHLRGKRRAHLSTADMKERKSGSTTTRGGCS